MPLISGNQLSEMTGKSWRTVQKRLAAAGIEATRREGNADLFEAPAAFAAIYLPDAPKGLDPAQERARRDRATADKLEQELAVRSGELMVATDAAAAWTDHIAAAKTKLLSLPTKLPPLLEGKTGPVMATLLRAEVHAALRELAGG
jgi:hypothetical protein